MKSIWLGLLVSLPFIALGDTEKSSNSNRVQCSVRTLFAHDVMSDYCYYRDEVVVGIRSLDPIRIRCARLEVSCDGSNTKDPKEDANLSTDPVF